MPEIADYGDFVTSEAKQITKALHEGKATEAIEQLNKDSQSMSPAEHMRLVQTVLHTPHKKGETFLDGFAICGDADKYWVSSDDSKRLMPENPCGDNKISKEGSKSELHKWAEAFSKPLWLPFIRQE